MENTLGRDLRGVALLYEWAATTLKVDLDDMLDHSEVPPGHQLESLIAFLRHKTTAPTDFNSLATVALKALSIRTFLMWVVDPASQGSSRLKSAQQMTEERAMLAAFFRPIERYAVSSERIRPLLPTEVDAIDSLAGPVRDEDGRLVLPLSFHGRNPFRPGTRLRNWLMVAMALQCGHRRGELLKIRLDDLPRSTDVGLKIRRRPHDSADPRRYKPRVKTAERILPISREIQIGLRTYLTSRAPIGRPVGRSPYLFVSGEGAPLSIAAADGIVKVVARHSGIDDLSWHSLRHTWAESLAEGLLNHHPQDHAFEILRDLGGWKRGSTQPMHYVQNVLRKRGIEFLRERNSRLYIDREAQ
jgi:integrase